MRVKQAIDIIDSIDNQVKNLLKFSELSDEEWEELADRLSINSSKTVFVNVCTNNLIEYRNMISSKVNSAEINL